ncbi:MAG: glutaredoxin family protein, partial [Clostridia bacterium]|nr:glutaredoxin family protein [Clostridia bacterium]
ENYRLPYYTMSPTYSICRNHGYLAGEQYTCPYCGSRTEVNSRITGYYRPIQNWNDGKVQEFKERKEYTILDWKQHKERRRVEAEQKAAEAEAEREAADNTPIRTVMLFTTETCPNCRSAKSLLAKHGVEYKEIDAYKEQELSIRYGIQSAPTLVIADGAKVETYAGVGAINRFLRTLEETSVTA